MTLAYHQKIMIVVVTGGSSGGGIKIPREWG
jgi:hypothetical protein